MKDATFRTQPLGNNYYKNCSGSVEAKRHITHIVPMSYLWTVAHGLTVSRLYLGESQIAEARFLLRDSEMCQIN
jgi:hypothetical protein